MKTYRGSCHCGAIRFAFKGPEKIENGLRCNCSICRRKGALMSGFTIAPDEIEIEATLATTSVDGDELDALVARISTSALVVQAFWSPSTTE